MKRWVFVVLLLLSVSTLIVPVLLDAQHPLSVAGRIRIPAADISAEVMTASHGSDCGCCGVLWQGGVAYTTADLSGVQVDDKAEIYTVDGGHFVLEFVGMTHCLKIGNVLIGWNGITRANGDVLLCDRAGATPFVRVFRFVRL